MYTNSLAQHCRARNASRTDDKEKRRRGDAFVRLSFSLSVSVSVSLFYMLHFSRKEPLVFF
jgi:hypothetical protein